MRLSGSATFKAGDTAELAARVAEAAQRATKRTADSCLQQAQVLVPIRTGALYNSGNVTEEPTTGVAQSCVNFDKGYAKFVEFGTIKMAAQPFLRPALDAHHGVLMDTAVEEAKGAIG